MPRDFNNDDLLKEARKIIGDPTPPAQLGESKHAKEADSLGDLASLGEDILDSTRELGENLSYFRKKVISLKDSWNAAVNTVKEMGKPFVPVVRPIVNVSKAVGRWYMNSVFNKFAYDKDEEGNRAEHINPKKAAKVIGASLVALALAFNSVAPAFHTAIDATRVMRSEEQTLYFGKPQYNADAKLYQVTACQSKDVCEAGSNALIFDIPDNNVLDAKYLFSEGRGYDPEHDIVSAFNSEFQKCTVDAVGHKPFRIFNYKWHPKILDKAICTPVMNMDG